MIRPRQPLARRRRPCAAVLRVVARVARAAAPVRAPARRAAAPVRAPALRRSAEDSGDAALSGPTDALGRLKALSTSRAKRAWRSRDRPRLATAAGPCFSAVRASPRLPAAARESPVSAEALSQTRPRRRRRRRSCWERDPRAVWQQRCDPALVEHGAHSLNEATRDARHERDLLEGRYSTQRQEPAFIEQRPLEELEVSPVDVRDRFEEFDERVAHSPNRVESLSRRRGLARHWLTATHRECPPRQLEALRREREGGGLKVIAGGSGAAGSGER
jgi:hypothetical protein